LFCWSFRSRNPRAARRRTTTATPTPMPAFAATGRPGPVDEDEGVLFVSPAGIVVVVVVVAVLAAMEYVVELVMLAVDEVEELDVEPVEEEEEADVCWRRTTTEEALASHFAQGCGFAGKTAKRATPESQQLRGPLKQQYSGVEVPVTLEHEMRSSPPSCKPKYSCQPLVCWPALVVG
jgi:hypothetical protein